MSHQAHHLLCAMRRQLLACYATRALRRCRVAEFVRFLTHLFKIHRACAAVSMRGKRSNCQQRGLAC
jgi:hypothetical protein